MAVIYQSSEGFVGASGEQCIRKEVIMFKCGTSERVHYSRSSTTFPYPIHCCVGPPFHLNG